MCVWQRGSVQHLEVGRQCPSTLCSLSVPEALIAFSPSSPPPTKGSSYFCSCISHCSPKCILNYSQAFSHFPKCSLPFIAVLLFLLPGGSPPFPFVTSSPPVLNFILPLWSISYTICFMRSLQYTQLGYSICFLCSHSLKHLVCLF